MKIQTQEHIIWLILNYIVLAWVSLPVGYFLPYMERAASIILQHHGTISTMLALVVSVVLFAASFFLMCKILIKITTILEKQ